MPKNEINFTRYILILVAIVVIVEYSIMIVFHLSGLEDYFSPDLESVVDALLLVLLAAWPVCAWVIKPIAAITYGYQEKLELLATALQDAGCAVMIVNADKNITYVNKSFTSVTGYTPDEVIGENPRILKSGRQSKAFYQMMWSALVNQGVWEGEIWNKRKNSEIYPELMHIKTIREEDGKIHHFVCVFSDATEMKEREERERQTQKMAAIGTLVGGVAHNFNNQLAGILGSVYLAERHAVDAQVIKHLKTIKMCAKDASSIVKQLLTFARESLVDKKKTAIVPLLEEAVKTARLGIPEDIKITTDFIDEGLMVYCDSVEIQQVVINFINNARDAVEASESKNILVSVKAKPWESCSLCETCSVCSAEVAQIVIEDTGMGINEHDLEYIFDPFFTTKKTGEGTGLGLSTAKAMIEEHGGAINVSSVAGHGTKFEICLPLTSMPQQTETTVQLEAISSKVQGKILVVDDEDIVRTTLMQGLLSLGYSVITAEDGKDGVQVFQKHMDDIVLVVTDIVMPKMDGHAAAKEMRKLNPDLPVIFITGYDSTGVDNATLDAEKTSTLGKPFSIEALSHAVHDMLDSE